MKQLHFVYLALGIVATILFFVFREFAYDSLYSVPGFSNHLFNAGLYDMIAWVTIVLPWVAAWIYYYAINSVRFDRWYHWLMVCGITMLITPIVCYVITTKKFDTLGLSYPSEAAIFSLANILWVAVFFVIASFSMRWWSTNCRHTPIPQ